MQRRALSHRVNDPLELMRAVHFHIGDGARGWLQVQIEVTRWRRIAEGDHLHGAATALRIQRYPELAPSRGRGAQIHQHQRHEILAEDVE
jgi:hypothetical protein